MTKKRLLQTLMMWTKMSSRKRVEYLKKQKIFGAIGDNVLIMDRKIPLYANLIRLHDNVRIASHVTFATHDVTHTMLNNMLGNEDRHYQETIGCIEIMDNVFIGTNVTIIGGVRIGPNAIVAAGAVVSRDVPPNSVVGGVPAKVICSLDEYVAKRKVQYPEELAPKHQEVSDGLADYLWNAFYKARDDK